MTDKLRRILIAEDDDDSRIALKLMLKLSKFDVIEARDGREAVNKIGSDKPDLVLMDLSLPVIDGLQATQEIRSQPEFQNLPIIFVTGYDNRETIDRIRAGGGTDYICKPIEFDDLKKMIETYLAVRRD
ncbi:MAG: response regulator [Acidobacteriota bacterium]